MVHVWTNMISLCMKDECIYKWSNVMNELDIYKITLNMKKRNTVLRSENFCSIWYWDQLNINNSQNSTVFGNLAGVLEKKIYQEWEICEKKWKFTESAWVDQPMYVPGEFYAIWNTSSEKKSKDDATWIDRCQTNKHMMSSDSPLVSGAKNMFNPYVGLVNGFEQYTLNCTI